ncbi:exodeoxyribonuclease III [Pararhizobium haloflavum]|uniref:exodeoxyribonuclease III n=1 Tax=Pararhizobium haloflavum TaxID=2037914 RepID=UPI000C18E7E5|nr:exodeoxyribonuclease III [Pararhizobium haloflavum]
MPFSIATWNINSVRLRLPLVEAFLAEHQPDVLCLQETKCPNDAFPFKRLRKLGYEHIVAHGQKGYHGVATLSRTPILAEERMDYGDVGHARHASVVIAAGVKKIRLHNFYVPAGGDVPDPAVNPKFAHKLAYLDEMRLLHSERERADGISSILVGDLNIAPLETDVWSHRQLLKVVSHTPIETDGLKDVQSKGAWVDLVRRHIPPEEKIFTWWSYRARDWEASDRGRRLDHIWSSADLAGDLTGIDVLRAARGWERPSDHVPVIARFGL